MMEGLAHLVPLAEGTLWAAGLVFLRLGAMMALLPAFGEQSVPVRVRLGLAVAFTAVVLPAVAPRVTLPEGPALLAHGAAEVGVGLIFGLTLRLFVMALQIAGSIAAQSTSLSQIFGGSAGVDPQPAIGHVLVVAGLALAALLGLHVRIAEYMILSYDLVPPGRMPGAEVVGRIGLSEISRAFALGFTLAAPFVVASLLYNVTLGVINRAMPQLMVAFVGAPAITAGGLALLMLAAPLLLGLWAEALGTTLANPFGDWP